MATMTAGGALLGVYRPAGPVFTGGEGSWLIAEDGSRFLDFTSGIAVNALGYGDATVADAIRAALDSGVIHTSNLFRTRPAGELAEWLTDNSFADRVFFCNSGAEANEGALKFARRWAGTQAEGRTRVVSFRNSFHGRTMGALAATDRPAYQEPFRPLMPGVRFCEVGDIGEAERCIRGGRVAAVIIEPIQAEGGVMPVPPAFLKALRLLCDEEGALLIFDEVQVGLGRTGTLWAHEAAGVTPDIMTLAKPLAGGLPMGAVLMTERVAAAIQPGDHGTTFGGGPLVASAALASCRRIGEPAFLAEVRRKAHELANRLGSLSLRHEAVKAVRGAGMIWGVEVQGSAADVVARALDAGLLLCAAGPNVVRILPPLTASDDELRRGTDLLDEVL
ncbi:MAG TPA: acetylornithine/succinylornithine family transaminase [Longimicrobium sp.]|nr:acetylornithine/succinylornithine family transaminase [Longimicrobium sp.]